MSGAVSTGAVTNVFKHIKSSTVQLAAFEASSSAAREFVRRAHGAKKSCGSFELSVAVIDPPALRDALEDKCRTRVTVEFHDGKKLEFPATKDRNVKNLFTAIFTYINSAQVPEKA
jgi:hypothetical protein